jgi:hypothetical protein
LGRPRFVPFSGAGNLTRFEVSAPEFSPSPETPKSGAFWPDGSVFSLVVDGSESDKLPDIGCAGGSTKAAQLHSI